MNRVLEIAAMVLGGVSLFTMCFLAFAVMAGVPLHEVAVIGKLFPEPDTAVSETATTGMDPGSARTDQQIVSSNLGVLSTWKLESPYSYDELGALADELKLKNLQLDQRIREVAQRELESDRREEILADRFETLEGFQSRLEGYEQELELRAAEVRRDEEAVAERDDQRWAGMARILQEQTTPSAGKRLLKYEPEDAAKILRAMDPDVAIEILNGLTDPQFSEYSEAYVRTAATEGQ